MKSSQNGLRLMIATTSLGAFLGGWILLAHASKPVVANASIASSIPVPLPTLPPLGADNSTLPNFQPLPALPPLPDMSLPLLRTHGS